MLTEAQSVARPTTASPSYYRARYYDPMPGRFLSEDPVQFASGIDFYAYVSNHSPNYADPSGLSEKDVQAILDHARKVTNQMTQNGQRIDPGQLNNILASLEWLNPFRKKTPHLGCGQQADLVSAALQIPDAPYDDKWTFTVVQEGWHQFGVARSSNPSDPNIIYDPWNNRFFTTPKVGWPFVP